MGNPKNFATNFTQKQPSSRSLTDPVTEEPEVTEEAQEATPQQMVDALYYILMQRLDHIEHLIQETDCQCQKK